LSSSHRTKLILWTTDTSTLFAPNLSSWTSNAFFSLASYKSLRTSLAFRNKVVLLILEEILILFASFTFSIFKYCSNLARNTRTGQKFLHICAFLLRNTHYQLRLLIISKSTSNHNRILLVHQKVKCETLSPR